VPKCSTECCNNLIWPARLYPRITHSVFLLGFRLFCTFRCDKTVIARALRQSVEKIDITCLLTVPSFSLQDIFYRRCDQCVGWKLMADSIRYRRHKCSQVYSRFCLRVMLCTWFLAINFNFYNIKTNENFNTSLMSINAKKNFRISLIVRN